MNWKAFTIACVSAAAIFFPLNGFTCADSDDPHDYFTSFFSRKLAAEPVYEPFYYTALLDFYDEDGYWRREDSMAFVNNSVAREWTAYGKADSVKAAVQLVYKTKPAELQSLVDCIRSGKPIPASLAKNALARNLVRDKKTEAVNYLVFATQTEKVSSSTDWEANLHDSLQIDKFIGEANAAFANAKDPFLKNKYAFQRCKLAFYNNRFTDCIRWYDDYFTESSTAAVAQLALSYKAGSLFRTGKLAEAAYTYSKAFLLSDQNKKSNYLGFLWASDFCNQDLIPAYTALCKNTKEKAGMTALFGLYGTGYRLDVLQKLHQLDPSSTFLPLLATREINKLEEQYLTPLLDKEKGGKSLYGSWIWNEDDSTKAKADDRAQVVKTAQFFETLLNEKSLPHRGLYGAGAAYLHFVNKDYEGAKTILAKASAVPVDEKTKEQLQLINLLIAANEDKTIAKERESQLLPSLKWLVQKAKTDGDYQIFCRNFFSQILAQKYEQQGSIARAALAYALSDMAFLYKGKRDDYSYGMALGFAREEMNTASLLDLYNIMTAPATETEKFLVQNASIQRDDVIDVIGTSHLRDRNYSKAIEWLSKAHKLQPLVESQYNYQTDKETTVNVDPFHDYLNDWQRLSKSVAVPYTKLTLAKKLQEMDTKIRSGAAVADKARLYYQYASALYNLSYYGNSWNAVAYYRTGGDWNEGTYSLPWQKEYFGVSTAKTFYQKAYEAATDKEFKAACLFMVAKCAQRQIPRPTYEYNSNYEAYEKADSLFQQKFKNNLLFGRFQSEFSTTRFYQYAYNRCSYLRDYVKQTAPAKRR
ncbi:hypothetical protein [Flavisolibacter nicotianae]|uniref:hypothetical protein n=1 Tax=Flavisolibacter nicotianae TaxID=2364882 RepID=UPI000EB1CE23|nr:hypothetical protein [Flavisolibacter nicotianae]